MKTRLFKTIAICSLMAAGASTSLLGQTFTGVDIGSPTLAGSSTTNADGTITIVGGGADIWDSADHCQFYYTTVTGLWWDAQMRIISLNGPDTWSKVNLMVRRPTPVGGAPTGGDPQMSIVDTRTNGQNLYDYQYRPTPNAASVENVNSPVTPPRYPNFWVRITRSNTVFKFWSSTNGTTWTNFNNQNSASLNAALGAWEDPILVGPAVTAHNDTDAGGATAVISNLTVTVHTVLVPTVANVQTQIQSTVTAIQDTDATFKFAATNNAQPAFYVMEYNWYKNGQLVATNIGSQYGIVPRAADNGAQIYAVANVQAPYSSISVTSAVCTLTVLPGSQIYTNGIKREVYFGRTRTDIETGNIGPADRDDMLTIMQTPGGLGNNYAARYTGYFIPQTNDNYVFFVASDDDTDLWLSTDGNPANKRLIAQESGYSATLNWITIGGNGSTSSQKRSDQWLPDTNTLVAPYAGGIPLTAGHLYYLEADFHQGTGGDNFAITYQTETQLADPNNIFIDGTASIMCAASNNIALVTYPGTNVTMFLQPKSVSIFEGDTASFTTGATTDGEMIPLFTWYLNGVAYPGVTGTNLNIPAVTLANNGNTVYVVASSAEGGINVTSSTVSITVQKAVFELGFVKDERWDNNTTRGQVENGQAGTPNYVMAVPGFEVSVDNPGNQANFSRRVSGYFIPDTTGRYVFFVNGDDDTDLFLSTNNLPQGKQLVCQETGWSNPWNWNSAGGGGSSIAQKRSDSWTPNASTPAPWSAGIPLTASNRYYIEMVFHQGGGGANCEATFKLTTDPDPANGTDTRLKGSLIGINAITSTNLVFTSQPASATVNLDSTASFSATASSSDAKLAVGAVRGQESTLTNNFLFYRWYVNGVLATNANTANFTVGPLLPSDSGMVVMCQTRILGFADANFNAVWSNSLSATVTVIGQQVFEPGLALMTWWTNANRVDIESGGVSAPTYMFSVPAFEGPNANTAPSIPNYATKCSGYFVPPTNGNYVFFVNSDDDSDLFLSTNSSRANMVKICAENVWSNPFQWTAAGSGGAAATANKRSDQFTDASGNHPFSAGIPLVAGQKYYMEGIHKNGSGGDNFEATFKLTSDPDPVNGTETRLVGNTIGFYAPRIPWVAFLQQPVNKTVLSGANPVTFSVLGTNYPTIWGGTSGGGANPTNLFTNTVHNALLYQWYKNGVAISNATSASYTQPQVLPADANAQFVCQMRALGLANDSLVPIWSNSATASLTVITDTVPPTILSAYTLTNANDDPIKFIVNVTFSKWMNTASLTNPSHYTVVGANVTNVIVSADSRIVELDLDHIPALPLSVSVSGVSDLSGNVIAPNSSVSIGTVNLTFTDIGTNVGNAFSFGQPGVDPAYPSIIWADEDGFVVQAEGSDIWNAADGFNYGWEQKTGDFDVVVRQVSNGHTSNYGKGGLMVREDLTAASRNWNIINNPNSSEGIQAVDGSGPGANVVECNTRTAYTSNSVSWSIRTRDNVPSYPNAWVRLKRIGNVLQAFVATNGAAWLQVGGYDTSTNVFGALIPTVYLGVCTTAHNNDSATGTAPPPPYRYYNTVEYANYNSAYIAPATLAVGLTNGNVVVSWAPTAGHLQSSPAVAGPGINWQNVAGSSPVTIPVTTGPQYFRVLNP